MEAEHTIVVEHRKELSFLLCQAAEIEHLAMCQYLYAAFSLRTEPGPGLTETQVSQVTTWRRELLSIAAEEMLHWALVNNLLTAIGSAPFVSRPNLPHRAQGYPPTVQFALLPYGEKALRHFIYFERPDGADVAGVAELVGSGPGPAPMSTRELQPRTQDYVSQGQLYRALDDGLVHLAGKLGENGLFIGPPWAQAGPESFGWPDLIAVTDLATARAALVRIIEQGEGGVSRADGTSHFDRFSRLLTELREVQGGDAGFQPSHPVVAATVRTIEGEEPSGPLITDPVTAEVSDLFNVVNDLVLQILCRYFAFGHESGDQRSVLAGVAVHLMFGAIAPLGSLLARLPVGDDHPGDTAGANFQLAYRSSFLLPHRRVAWIRFAERLHQTADQIESLAEHPLVGPALAPVATLLRSSATSLEAEVEPLVSLDGEAPQTAADAGSAAMWPPSITATPGGPYILRGAARLRRMREVFSEAGEPMAWQVTEPLDHSGESWLCRCGGSRNKPFCDGTHATRDWDSTEHAPESTFDERAETRTGPGITLRADDELCSHAGFCGNRFTGIFAMLDKLEPDDSASRALMMAMVEHCPSGALAFRVDASGPDIEPELPEAVGVIEDGPLYVSGGVCVQRADGRPIETRNRMVLCRCGQSATKPLCDGAHKAIDFRG